MAKYTKKPVTIEAAIFTHDMAMGNAELPPGVKFSSRRCHHGLNRLDSHRHYIPTLVGNHDVQIGDYIITGVKGEHYPCKPDIFRATYVNEDGTEIK